MVPVLSDDQTRALLAAAGIVAADNAADSAEHPTELHAFNVKLYSVPAAKPVLLNDKVAAVIVLDTSVPPRRSSNRVIGEPFDAGAVQDTRIADAVADVNVSVGASGTDEAATGAASVSTETTRTPVTSRNKRRRNRRTEAVTPCNCSEANNPGQPGTRENSRLPET